MRSKEAKVKEHSHYYLYQPSATASRLYLYPIALGYFEYETGYSLWRNSYDSFLLMKNFVSLPEILYSWTAISLMDIVLMKIRMFSGFILTVLLPVPTMSCSLFRELFFPPPIRLRLSTIWKNLLTFSKKQCPLKSIWYQTALPRSSMRS